MTRATAVAVIALAKDANPTMFRVWWLRSGGGGVRFVDGNPFESFA